MNALCCAVFLCFAVLSPLLCCAELSYAVCFAMRCLTVFFGASLCFAVLRCTWLCFAVLRCLCFVYRLLAALCMLAFDMLYPMLAGIVWMYVLFVFGMLNLHGAEGYANTAHEHAER